MALIFDLDQTLVDTKALEHLRKQRKWSEINKSLHLCKLYPCIFSIFQFLNAIDVKIAVVSKSPRSYIHQVLTHFQLSAHVLIGYHDVYSHLQKPHPAPVNLALHRLQVEAHSCIGFGDHSDDIKAYKAAGIVSVACLWGCDDEVKLLASNPDMIAISPFFVRGILKDIYPQLHL
jgi:beta-phosphoglucomutase-like phosphatase (HAD superfamily)